MQKKVELTYSQKLELAEFICLGNNGVLTGSLMLRMRGIDLGHIGDIDILVETTDPNDITLPPLCVGKEIVKDEGYSVLKRCFFLGNKIEFITVDTIFQNMYDSSYDFGYDMNIAKVSDLLEAKKFYLRHNSNPEYLEKTKRDIEVIEKWLLTNNK